MEWFLRVEMQSWKQVNILVNMVLYSSWHEVSFRFLYPKVIASVVFYCGLLSELTLARRLYATKIVQRTYINPLPTGSISRGVWLGLSIGFGATAYSY